jgi:hypothetical protein
MSRGDGGRGTRCRDAFRAAKPVLDRQSEEAATYAAGRANLPPDDGKMDGAVMRRNKLAAIEELRGSQEPPSHAVWCESKHPCVSFPVGCREHQEQTR